MLLGWNGMQGIPPPIVIIDCLRKPAIIIAITVCRHAAWQAQADVTLSLRIAEAEPRHRKNHVRQFKNGRYLVDLVANNADGTDPETGRFSAQDQGLHRKGRIDAGIEEAFQCSVPDRFSA